MSETRKNHLTIDGAQAKEEEHGASYKAIPESDTEFRTSKTSLHKSKDKLSADGAEEKLLQKEDEAKITTRVDMADAKYVVGDHRNGDAKIELDANKRQFTGLTKEELMKYAEDPFWVRLRWFMFILFWALWLCMLGGAIAIIIRAPKCAAPTPKTWSEKGPLVDLALSMDDYREAEESLEKLQQYEVTGVFASVCQNSYEVLEDTTCLDQFKAFAEKAKKFGIKVIVDLTANFVPDTHTWFQLSENRSEEYKDYFLWVKSDEYDSDNNSTIPKPPNDWVSTVNTPAWSWSDKRKEYYLNQYGEGLPDLNFENVNVVRKFDEVIELFMKAGAGGIRLHRARRLVVNTVPGGQVPHTGAGSDPGADHSQHPFWRHTHTTDQPQLDALLPHWAHLVARAAGEPTVFTLAEPSLPELFVLHRNTSYLRPPSAAPLAVLPAPRPAPAPALAPGPAAAGAPGASAVALLRERLPRWPALQLTDENADEELAAFAMLLPAAPVVALEQLNDKDNTTSQNESLKRAVSLRADGVVQHGLWSLAAVPVHDSDHTMLAVARWKSGHSGYVCVFNAGASGRASLAAVRSLPASLTVHHVSPATRRETNYTSNLSVNSSDIYVPSKSSVIFSYAPKDTAVN